MEREIALYTLEGVKDATVTTHDISTEDKLGLSLLRFLRGPAVPPPPEERGWKDTVKTMPGEVTRIIARFDLPPHTKLPAEYVYHCHILEHEDNEMMRPYRVTQPLPGRPVKNQRSR